MTRLSGALSLHCSPLTRLGSPTDYASGAHRMGITDTTRVGIILSRGRPPASPSCSPASCSPRAAACITFLRETFHRLIASAAIVLTGRARESQGFCSCPPAPAACPSSLLCLSVSPRCPSQKDAAGPQWCEVSPGAPHPAPAWCLFPCFQGHLLSLQLTS